MSVGVELNGYTLTREWYNFRFENPNKAKHVHSDLYFYIIDRWNRFGQKEIFTIPTATTMEALGIGSYNTYKTALHDLIEFGFIEVIEWSRNQHYSTVIALSKNDKAIYKALDKASDKADDKAIDKAFQSYINNRIIEQENNQLADNGFEEVWETYGRLGSRKLAEAKWKRLPNKARHEIIDFVPKYLERHTQTGKTEFLPHFITFLNQEKWKDELPYGNSQMIAAATGQLPAYERLRRHAKANGCEAFTLFKGTMPDDKVIAYYCKLEGMEDFKWLGGNEEIMAKWRAGASGVIGNMVEL